MKIGKRLHYTPDRDGECEPLNSAGVNNNHTLDVIPVV